MKLHLVLAAAAAGCFSMVSAQTQRDLDSHAHGSATLNLALDSASVFLELDTPWNNIIGFEHAPHTAEQHELFDAALVLLNNPDELFSFKGTDCVVSEVMLDSSLSEHDSDDDKHEEHDSEHHDESEEKHDDEHHSDADSHSDEKHGDTDDEHHNEHESEHHDEHDNDADTHSSVLTSYVFNCDNIERLSAIDMTFLEVWSGFESVEVQMTGPGGQTSTSVSSQNMRVDLSSIR